MDILGHADFIDDLPADLVRAIEGTGYKNTDSVSLACQFIAKNASVLPRNRMATGYSDSRLSIDSHQGRLIVKIALAEDGETRWLTVFEFNVQANTPLLGYRPGYWLVYLRQIEDEIKGAMRRNCRIAAKYPVTTRTQRYSPVDGDPFEEMVEGQKS